MLVLLFGFKSETYRNEPYPLTELLQQAADP